MNFELATIGVMNGKHYKVTANYDVVPGLILESGYFRQPELHFVWKSIMELSDDLTTVVGVYHGIVPYEFFINVDARLRELACEKLVEVSNNGK